MNIYIYIHILFSYSHSVIYLWCFFLVDTREYIFMCVGSLWIHTDVQVYRDLCMDTLYVLIWILHTFTVHILSTLYCSRYALQVTLHIHSHICAWHFICTHTYNYVLYIFLVCNFFYKIWFSPVICLRIRMCEFCLWSTACFIGCSLSYSQNFINSFIHPYKHV